MERGNEKDKKCILFENQFYSDGIIKKINWHKSTKCKVKINLEKKTRSVIELKPFYKDCHKVLMMVIV